MAKRNSTIGTNLFVLRMDLWTVYSSLARQGIMYWQELQLPRSSTGIVVPVVGSLPRDRKWGSNFSHHCSGGWPNDSGWRHN